MATLIFVTADIEVEGNNSHDTPEDAALRRSLNPDSNYFAGGKYMGKTTKRKKVEPQTWPVYRKITKGVSSAEWESACFPTGTGWVQYEGE